MPDWIIGEIPEPHNSSYYYKVFEGVDENMETARNQAIKKAFQQAMAFVSTSVNSSDVYQAIEHGSSLNVISETFSIPIYFTCEFFKELKDKKIHYWILCQIAVRGNVIPQFNTHFTDCNTHDVWDNKKKEAEDTKQQHLKKINNTALAASIFVPGAGQMYKGEGGKGAGILVSELALIGGGVGTYFVGRKQLNIMKDKAVEYNAFCSAQKTYNTMRIISYTCYGAAAALHIFNICHAYLMSPNSQKFPNITYTPTVIPVNEYTTPTYALGLGMIINF
jgi:TM2 domain-containing membrane protein YozV